MNHISLTVAVIAAASLLGACRTTSQQPEEIRKYSITSSAGIKAEITNFGARIMSLTVPDRNGNPTDIVLGYDSISEYIANDGNFGAVIGRYANRIGHATFMLDDSVCHVEKNNGENHLHGGNRGFHNAVWDAHQLNDSTLSLDLVSPDGDAGFPGNMNVNVTYSLSGNILSIEYSATSDRPTVVNLTNHSYFNLTGNSSNDILDNILTINASHFTPVDSIMLPTGEISPLDKSPLDFRTAKQIGRDINADNTQIKYASGFDHNYVLDTNGSVDTAAARLYCPANGIVMTLFTNQPGMQLYTTNFMDDNAVGKKGRRCIVHGAVCLEPQHYPDSPNRSEFPSTRLNPGETFSSVTKYRFTTE